LAMVLSVDKGLRRTCPKVGPPCGGKACYRSKSRKGGTGYTTKREEGDQDHGIKTKKKKETGEGSHWK